jgi:iron complex transport system permease protein
MEAKIKRWALILTVLLALTIVVAVISMAMGSASISPDQVVLILLSKIPVIGNYVNQTWSDGSASIITTIRMPRVLLGLLVGGSLGLAGVTTQGVFKNPLADPYILGISSGAALGASIIILIGATLIPLGIITGAFIGALIGAFIVFSIARTHNRVPVETLLLAGIAVSAFFSACTYFLMFISGHKLNQIVFWVMGALWNGSWGDVIIIVPFLVIGSIVIYAFSRDLNLMLLGEEDAAHLGTNVPRVKTILLIVSALLAAAAVSVSGIIGFVGLVIPHIMRLILGPDHRILIPASLLVGAMFLVLADTFARVIMQPSELPVGIVTAAIGAPFFVYLLIRKKRSVA